MCLFLLPVSGGAVNEEFRVNVLVADIIDGRPGQIMSDN